MRKTVAFILIFALVFSAFTGAVLFASATSAAEAMDAAEPELYGLYTAQSANVLRDAYDRVSAALAAGGNGIAEADKLTAALAGLAPLEECNREPLLGFGGLTDADITAMKLRRGEISVNDGVVTVSGKGTLRYCNAVSGGISGPSPFGIATPSADGLVLAIDSDSDARLDIEIGRRSSAEDCVFTISDVYVSAGERYYLFPFDRFGEPPLDGTLNFISLTFTGTARVSFRDLCAATASAGSAGSSGVSAPAGPSGSSGIPEPASSGASPGSSVSAVSAGASASLSSP